MQDSPANRYEGLYKILGKPMADKLFHLQIFMVGVGALGCELLKNFAMLGLGTGEEDLDNSKMKGLITITDPDSIELSNLSRQFLFREKHIGMPKSFTAAAAAQQMNASLKNHISLNYNSRRDAGQGVRREQPHLH